MGYNKVQPYNRTSPSFVTRVDEMDISNVLTIMPFTSLKFTIGHSGNALKTQYSEVLVLNEDYKKTSTSLDLESGRTSMSMNFTRGLVSNELRKSSSGHCNPQQASAVQSTKTASLRPQLEVPQKKPTTRSKALGGFSIVAHFEVMDINENLK